jgi:D-amino-acid oxidase
MSSADAVVVGAGVAGLTTAISLTEAGLSTRIVTAAPPRETTSVAAGAIWGPVRCGPPDRTYEWARTGLAVLSELTDEPAAAIRQVSGIEVAAGPATPPEWLNLVPDLRLLADDELPDGFSSGWHYTAPVVTMPLYLDYLRSRYESRGGTIEVAPVTSLASVDARVVVNCTGIGARDLVPDPAVYPVRGQVVVVENPGIDEFYIDHTLHGDDYVYMFPHGDTVLLGGTAQQDDWDLLPRLHRGPAAPARGADRGRACRPAPVPARGAAGIGTAARRPDPVAQLRSRRRRRHPHLGLRPRDHRGGAGPGALAAREFPDGPQEFPDGHRCDRATHRR